MLIQTHTAWLLDLLENQGKVKQVEGGLFFYKDLDREFQLLEEKYEGIKPTLKVVFQDIKPPESIPLS